MTLKITRFLTDAFNKQAKISHFSSKIQVGVPDKISMTYLSRIKSQFGELFLEDANYIIMTKLGADEAGFDKAAKKFVDVIATVLDTEVSKSEVKTLDLSEDTNSGEDSDDEGKEEAVAPSSVILLVKVTTK